jgi:adenylosuccinate synthase
MNRRPGVTVLVDGQYGSTGKGVLASYMASKYADRVDVVVSNAGPNSGHTFYHGTEKIVLKQLPTFAVASAKLGRIIPIYLSAGAIIDPEILNREVEEYNLEVFLHPNAAVITPEDKAAEHSGSIAAVAGTRAGVGHALARKVMREPSAVARSYEHMFSPRIKITGHVPHWHNLRVFMEISQGFSLGINEARFYPKTTSRECTVMQGLADARISPAHFSYSAMVVRTFPIRVGNHEGFSSGDCYPDQKETSWEELGVTPELTTVTQRVRRVFTFSPTQFVDAMRANTPRLVLVNFMNYLKEEQRQSFAELLTSVSLRTVGYKPKMLWGYGPRWQDVRETP